MTDRISEIQERLDKATPGVWSQDVLYGSEFIWAGEDDDALKVAEGFGIDNANFIADAKQDIPYLLAEIERLKGAGE